MYTSADQFIATERIARLRAEAAHDALVRACVMRNREAKRAMAQGAERRRWLPWGRTPVPSPALD